VQFESTTPFPYDHLYLVISGSEILDLVFFTPAFIPLVPHRLILDALCVLFRLSI